MICIKCNKERKIVNKHFKMCLECNNKRLRELKSSNVCNVPKVKISCLKTSKKNKIKNYSFVKNLLSKKTTSEKIKEDEKFYKKCFEKSNHKCEECNKELPNYFLDHNGKVAARWRYSHIVPKSIAPELRHTIKNINHLCLLHHIEWENGDKKKMKIYSSNKKRLPNYF